jgi:hypothetical protein
MIGCARVRRVKPVTRSSHCFLDVDFPQDRFILEALLPRDRRASFRALLSLSIRLS